MSESSDQQVRGSSSTHKKGSVRVDCVIPTFILFLPRLFVLPIEHHRLQENTYKNRNRNNNNNNKKTQRKENEL